MRLTTIWEDHSLFHINYIYCFNLFKSKSFVNALLVKVGHFSSELPMLSKLILNKTSISMLEAYLNQPINNIKLFIKIFVYSIIFIILVMYKK